MTGGQILGLVIFLIIVIALVLYLNPTWATAVQDQWTAWTSSSASSTGQPAPVNTDPSPVPPTGTTKPSDPTLVTPVAAAVNPDGLVGQLCGVKADNTIWCANKNLDTTPNWYQIQGALSNVSVNNGRLYGVGPGASGIYYLPDFTNPDGSKWVSIGGQLNNAVLNGNAICGTNAIDAIWCGNQNIDNSSINWTNPPGSLNQLAFDKGRLLGVNKDNQIFYASDYTNPQWQQVQGTLKNVSLSDDLACGVDLSNNAYCASIADPSKVQWQKMQPIPGSKGVAQTSVRGNKMFAVDPDNQVSFYDSLDPVNLSAAVPKKVTGVLNQIYW